MSLRSLAKAAARTWLTGVAAGRVPAVSCSADRTGTAPVREGRKAICWRAGVMDVGRIDTALARHGDREARRLERTNEISLGAD